MPEVIKKVVTTTTANTAFELVVPTGITVDGRQGMSITGCVINWLTMGANVPGTATASLEVTVSTETGQQLWDDPDNIIYWTYYVHGAASSTSAFQMTPVVSLPLVNPRVTVQPNLYFRIAPVGNTANSQVGITLFYEFVKLTDVEVMRLLQGGA